ncbi:MAG: hypothetical protein Unbinned92contig1004_28 [Prokaryotic dsDNA virus sp.]|nr:MAG: hypothetical protein Unbinned92contig1004_28 [Prokaryotic dsDNA virus sp.]|tara:strand:+ start:21863 stop:22525 length:663 start_codon:yes stop_codon:yes gene_type:complete
MSVIEKLKEAVRSVVQERQDLYAEARLNDGRVIATEAEQFSAGAPVRVLSDDGEAAPLEAGTYELSDGGEVTVDAESQVVEMEEEEKKDEEMQEEDKDEMGAVKAALIEEFQISEDVADQIMDVIKEAMKPAKMEEEKEEEMEEEEKKEEMQQVEMAAVTDLTHEMAVALEAINKRLEQLESAPAASPDRVLPKHNPIPKADNPRSSSFDNAFNIINSFK